MGPGSNGEELCMINPETGERVTVGYIQDLDELADERGGVGKLIRDLQQPISVTFSPD